MQDIITIIKEFGFPIAVAIGLGIFTIKFVNKIQNENIAREKRMLDDSSTRENKLLDMLATYADTLEDYAKMLDVHGKELSNITKILEGLQRDVCMLKKD